jgi:malate dehydrogenase (oxaloacetate-decarboxylating)(NADP+)
MADAVDPHTPPLPGDFPRGVKLLHDPVRNKGTAFTEAERHLLGLRGLLPPRVATQELQVRRVMENLRQESDDLERYLQLSGLQDRNETLFYRVLSDHLEELLPIVYTPTVGKVCQRYGHIFRRPRGLFVTPGDRGRVREVLRNWPHREVRMIVVTDGQRILGLGDLGAEGMGIPIGKLSLYTACGGIPPTACLPVTIDVGTDNDALRSDPLYVGLPERRLRGPAYDELLDEFVVAVQEMFPDAVIQLEDFGTDNAFRLLARWRHRARLFDDDIQGTAGVVVAGLMAAERVTRRPLESGCYLFFGAREAGVGIGDLLVSAMRAKGVPEREARERCWFFDREGLVVSGRERLAAHKRAFARDHPPLAALLAAVNTIRPTALIGSSAVPGAFTRPVLEAMARLNERPLVFALSNPTSASECTADEAYRATEGRAIFASGSPFPPVELDGRRFVAGQANNAYVFPGVGLGVIVARAAHVTDSMFLAAAGALAARVDDDDLAVGRVYPPLRDMRAVSADIAAAVIEVAVAEGLARTPAPDDPREAARAAMFDPRYPRYA